MIGTKLHWVDGPWQGKLALAARPRGGDWLGDEITNWHRVGVDAVFSLLTNQEEQDLDITKEAAEAKINGMKFFSFPILDRDVPSSEKQLSKTLEAVDRELSSGRNVVVHCRQGVGRTGLVAACLLLSRGIQPGTAIEKLTLARGVPVPETDEQRRWIMDFAKNFATLQ